MRANFLLRDLRALCGESDQACHCSGHGTSGRAGSLLSHEGERGSQHLQIGATPVGVFAQVTPEQARTGLPVEETQHVARHGIERYAFDELASDVFEIGLYGIVERSWWRVEETCIDAGKHRGRLI